MDVMIDNERVASGGAASRGPYRPERAGALIIGDCYQALGIVRSLGRQGIPVWVIGNGHVVAAVSRYVRRTLAWPAGDTARQVGYLLDLAVRHHLDGWTIYPTTDEHAALLARHHAVLAERFLLATPPWGMLRWAYDKRHTYRIAADLGIDHPRTYYPDTRSAVAELDPAFPLILKPAFKERANRFTLAKAWRVEDRGALLARYDDACTLVSPDVIMLQEVIPGGGEEQYSFAALCAEGRPLAWMVVRRAPVSAGVRAGQYICRDGRPP